MVEGRAIDVKSDQRSGEMPSKEEIFAKLLYLINAPAQRLVTAMNASAAIWRWWWIRACKENKFQQA